MTYISLYIVILAIIFFIIAIKVKSEDVKITFCLLSIIAYIVSLLYMMLKEMSHGNYIFSEIFSYYYVVVTVILLFISVFYYYVITTIEPMEDK